MTKPARPKAAETARVRKIERRLRARLARMFPQIDVKAIIVELRPLIHEAARDGLEDHDAAWRRMAAAPLFRQIAKRLTAAMRTVDSETGNLCSPKIRSAKDN